MADESVLRIVRLMVESGEITVEDIQRLAQEVGRPVVPTHAEFLATVVQRCPPPSRATYATGFRRLVDSFRERRVDEVGAAEIEQLAGDTLRAVRDSGHVDGSGAVRNLIHAARFYYRIAEQHGYRRGNPALRVALPNRPRRVRRALDGSELAGLYEVVVAGGDDPVLDLLLLDYHRETAGRRGGACALRLCDLRLDRPSVVLREKGGHEREVPASPDLILRIERLGRDRGATSPEDAALRYRSNRPLTRRRYNTLFERVQNSLPWARRLGVSVHWIRHTTLTDISNAAGSRVAAAYAGHADRSVTDIYTVPVFEDLVAAHDRVFPGSPCIR